MRGQVTGKTVAKAAAATSGELCLTVEEVTQVQMLHNLNGLL